MGSRASRYAPPPRRRRGAAAAASTLVVRRRVLVGAIAAVAALSATLATARPVARAGASGSDDASSGRRDPSSSPAAAAEPHATMQSGAYWTKLSPAERQIYLTGFLAGAAAEQARARAEQSGRAGDSAAVSSGAVEMLRRDRALHFRFAPAVYSAQVDDFYWNGSHAATPIVDAMIFFNGEMLKQQPDAPRPR
ncbi:MAG TPA: hypothetical protein VFJ74_14900 [Gemmatimonadaceae bacterium]|nr:hypothetical protein [Gemmatimonadaceae bacterium]